MNRDRAILWLAQGAGFGRIPWAPGTWGSLLGFALLALLLAPGSAWFALSGWLAAVGLSVYCCGAAERILGKSDPGSVVLDEIVAIPLCCAVWLAGEYRSAGHWPAIDQIFRWERIWALAAVFGLFRLFDIWKPWPVRQSQRWPGGWGVTGDDLLAAGYVNLVLAFWVA